MKETIYVFTNGNLKRKDNSLVYVTEEGEKKHIPVENVREIMVFAETTINKKLLEFLSQKEILLSYFNHYGYYMGTFYPREHYNSGFMILKQAEHYSDLEKRIVIARKFVEGAAKNSLKNLGYYNRRGGDLQQIIDQINQAVLTIETQTDINELMAIEGRIKQLYYDGFNEIIKSDDFKFMKRSRRPPKDHLNALISFANSIIYNYVLAEIYQTHLDPRIGYLHTTNNRRFTLNLDVAEIFKPVIGDRVIFSLLNKGIITADDFQKQMNGIMLKDRGKQKFLETIQDKLNQTIKHSKMEREFSYRRFIRMELYKLEKHLIGEQEYTPFVMDW
jgi:CRISPR-associated protein Cas1